MSLYFSHVISYNFYSTVFGKKTFSMRAAKINSPTHRCEPMGR
jgi:hypothetical protein